MKDGRPGLKDGSSKLLPTLIWLALAVIIGSGLTACQIEWPLAQATPEATPQPVAVTLAPATAPLPVVTPVALPSPPTAEPTNTPMPTLASPAPLTAMPPTGPTAAPTSQPTATPSVTATPTLEQLLELLPTATPTPRPTAELTFLATPVPVPISTATPIPTPDLPPPTRDMVAALVWLDHLVPWFIDPPGVEYEEAARHLLEMWFLDPYLSIEMAQMYWLATGLDEGELEALSLIAHVGSINIEEARNLSGYAWITDGIHGYDTRLIQKIQGDILLRDLPWARDDLQVLEPWAWNLLLLIAESDPQLVTELKTAPWIVNGIDQDDIQTLRGLLATVSIDAEVIDLLFSHPWAADGASESIERDIISALAEVSKLDQQLARFVASKPRLAENRSLSSWDRDWITSLSEIAERDLGLAWQLAQGYPDHYRFRDLFLATGLRYLIREKPALFRELVEQDWVKDGIDGKEAAFLTATEDIARHAPAEFEAMLEARYVAEATVFLPTSGMVNIWVTQRTPFPAGEDLAGDIAAKLQELERSGEDLPWDQDFIVHVVVVEPDSHSDVSVSGGTAWPNAAQTGSHIRIPRFGRNSPTRPAIMDYLDRLYPGGG